MLNLLVPLARPPHHTEIGREGEGRERFVFVSPLPDLQEGSPVEMSFRLTPREESHQPAWIVVRQRPQQDGVEEVEDQRGGGDAEGKDEEDSQGKARGSA